MWHLKIQIHANRTVKTGSFACSPFCGIKHKDHVPEHWQCFFLSGIRLFVLWLPRARAPRSMFEWAWAECAFDMSNISGFMCSVALTMSKHHVNRRYKWIIMNTNLHQFDETLAHILHSQRKKKQQHLYPLANNV